MAINNNINFAKGVLIMFVVWGHLLPGAYMPILLGEQELNLRGCIYLFHMPIFFYISGYLLNSKKFNKVLMIEKCKFFMGIFLLSSITYLFLFGSSARQFLLIFSSPYNHLWYIEVLTIFFVVTYFINVNVKHLYWIVPMAVIATMLRDMGSLQWLRSFGYKPIFRGAEYFLYFYLGILTTNYAGFKSFTLKQAILLFLIGIVLVVNDFQVGLYDDLSLYVGYSLGFVALNISISMFFYKFISGKNHKENVIGLIGKKALFIYLWHYAFCIVAVELGRRYLLWFELTYMSTFALALLITFILFFVHELFPFRRFFLMKYIGIQNR